MTPKPKPKIKRIKAEKLLSSTETIEHETNSNDSILEDLLGNEDMEQQYLQEISDSEMEQDMKPDAFQEFKMDDMQDDLTDENIISEFDLFGKSVALQLNHMEVNYKISFFHGFLLNSNNLLQLEDALLCQERLQVVLTEFRLKILKRKAKRST